jgi:hypothetical protein
MLAPTARLAITENEDRAIPEVLLPAQVAPLHAIAPERALLSSVLMDAVECFQKHHGARTGARRALFDDAEAWIFGPPGPGARFSFEEVCEHLSLDPECLRSGLRHWRASQPARAHSPLLRRRGRHVHTRHRKAAVVRRVA